MKTYYLMLRAHRLATGTEIRVFQYRVGLNKKFVRADAEFELAGQMGRGWVVFSEVVCYSYWKQMVNTLSREDELLLRGKGGAGV